jgi:hypothetical protein
MFGDLLYLLQFWGLKFILSIDIFSSQNLFSNSAFMIFFSFRVKILTSARSCTTMSTPSLCSLFSAAQSAAYSVQVAVHSVQPTQCRSQRNALSSGHCAAYSVRQCHKCSRLSAGHNAAYSVQVKVQPTQCRSQCTSQCSLLSAGHSATSSLRVTVQTTQCRAQCRQFIAGHSAAYSVQGTVQPNLCRAQCNPRSKSSQMLLSQQHSCK